MNDDKPNYWFKAKTYGYGWGLPSHWAGWLTMVVFLAGIIACSILLPPTTAPWPFALSMIGLGTAFAAVCWLKGEPARWRWGEDSTRRNNGDDHDPG